MRTTAIGVFAIGLILALLPVALPAGAQPIFETDEFRINVDQTGPQSNPMASFNRSGNFVGVWESELRGVVGRFFNRNRSPMGNDDVLVANDPIGPLPFRDSITVHKQPVVAVTHGSNLLLFWAQEEQDVSIDIFFESRYATARTIFGRAFNLNGQPLSDRFRVGQTDEGLESRPEVAVDANGDVTVVWERFEDGESGIFGRRFRANGQPLTSEFRIDDGAGAQDAARARVASLADGTSFVVWEGCCDGGDEFGEVGIFGRFFDPDGVALSDSFQINSTTEGNQRVPVVVGDDGRLVVAWQGPTGEVENGRPVFRVYGRRVNLESGLSGEERIVSSGLGRAHSSPALAVGVQGDVILAWMAWVDDFRVGVFGTRLSLDGDQIEPRTEAFQISQQPIGGQFRLGLTATPLGRFLAAWEGYGEDGKLRIAARLVLPASEAECAGVAGALTSKSPGSRLCGP